MLSATCPFCAVVMGSCRCSHREHNSSLKCNTISFWILETAEFMLAYKWDRYVEKQHTNTPSVHKDNHHSKQLCDLIAVGPTSYIPYSWPFRDMQTSLIKMLLYILPSNLQNTMATRTHRSLIPLSEHRSFHLHSNKFTLVKLLAMHCA